MRTTWHSGAVPVASDAGSRQQVLNIISVCLWAQLFGSQVAYFPSRIIQTSVFLWLYHILPHLIKSRIFGTKSTRHTKCVLWFSLQLLSETFLITRIQRDININVHISSCKVPVILFRFWSNLKHLDRFSKNPQISSTIKIYQMGAELFHADGQTDGRTERS